MNHLIAQCCVMYVSYPTHCRCMHRRFRLPLPPYRLMSLQLTQTVQSGAAQPAQSHNFLFSPPVNNIHSTNHYQILKLICTNLFSL